MNNNNGVAEEINALRKEKNAVILAHNYQLPDVQDIADYVGGLGLQESLKENACRVGNAVSMPNDDGLISGPRD